MKKLKAYISCPITISYSTLVTYGKVLKNMGLEVMYWNRVDFYETEYLQNCDIFLLILPNNAFNISKSNLPKGCKLEFDIARRLNKDMYLIYTPSFHQVEEYRTYQISISEFPEIIQGIRGTSNILSEKITEFNTQQKNVCLDGYNPYPKNIFNVDLLEKRIKQLTPDRRLLFFR